MKAGEKRYKSWRFFKWLTGYKTEREELKDQVAYFEKRCETYRQENGELKQTVIQAAGKLQEKVDVKNKEIAKLKKQLKEQKTVNELLQVRLKRRD